jgi:hypothetical protein
MPTKVQPRVKSILVADQVFQQAETGKWCLVGIFDSIAAASYPNLHPSLGVYLRLTGFHGAAEVQLSFEESSGERLAWIGAFKVELADPLAVVEIGFQTHGLLIPKSGTYFLRPFFDGEPSDADIKLTAVTRKG